MILTQKAGRRGKLVTIARYRDNVYLQWFPTNAKHDQVSWICRGSFYHCRKQQRIYQRTGMLGTYDKIHWDQARDASMSVISCRSKQTSSEFGSYVVPSHNDEDTTNTRRRPCAKYHVHQESNLFRSTLNYWTSPLNVPNCARNTEII